MSAQWRPEGRADTDAGLCLRPMNVADIDTVMAIEAACYAFPWSRGNFIDSLAAGYAASILCNGRGDTIGYFIAMAGVDEMHLLNITVAPSAQGRGCASVLMNALLDSCREQRANPLWLEVRQGNDRALAVYRHLGFKAVGVRKGYYPASFGRREDAVVMSLQVPPVDVGASDAVE